MDIKRFYMYVYFLVLNYSAVYIVWYIEYWVIKTIHVYTVLGWTTKSTGQNQMN